MSWSYYLRIRSLGRRQYRIGLDLVPRELTRTEGSGPFPRLPEQIKRAGDHPRATRTEDSQMTTGADNKGGPSDGDGNV